MRLPMENNKTAKWNRIDLVVSKLFTVLTWFTIVATVFILLNTTANVITRAFFNFAIFGSVQLSTIMLSLVVMCAMPVVTMYNTHIKVDLVAEKLPVKVQSALSGINLLVCAAIMLIGSYYTFDKAAKAYSLGTCTDALSIPYWPVYVLIAVMFIISALCAIYNFFRYISIGSVVGPQTFSDLRKTLGLKDKEDKNK